MKELKFDETRPLDLIPIGRITVDLNPMEYYCPLRDSITFKKYVGGSPANIAVGLSRLGKRVGFIGMISDDEMGEYVLRFFEKEGIDTSHVLKAGNREKMGLTFTEILSPDESSITMYRDGVADLSLSPDAVEEEYIGSAKAILISGTALSASPSREACLKALVFAKKTGTIVIFDIDYRAYTWKNEDEISLYYHMVAEKSDIIFGSREEFDLTERLHAHMDSDEQSAAYWHKKGAKAVIIKHGKQGSAAFLEDGKTYGIKPFPVKAFKLFGGGDGYASACIYGILEGWSMPDCLELGSASASLLVAAHGCSEFMPTLDEISSFIAESKENYGEMVAKGKGGAL